MARFLLGPGRMSAARIPADELDAIRRDYLADLEEQVALVRQHGELLRNRAKFKTSYPILLYLAHQLKGSGGTIGFPAVSALGKKLADALDGFLAETGERPGPGELSTRVGSIAGELEATVEAAKKGVAAR